MFRAFNGQIRERSVEISEDGLRWAFSQDAVAWLLEEQGSTEQENALVGVLVHLGMDADEGEIAFEPVRSEQQTAFKRPLEAVASAWSRRTSQSLDRVLSFGDGSKVAKNGEEFQLRVRTVNGTRMLVTPKIKGLEVSWDLVEGDPEPQKEAKSHEAVSAAGTRERAAA